MEGNFETFKGLYTQQLKDIKDAKQVLVADLSKEGRTDEAKFARIELNIIEIFEKMFQASGARGKQQADEVKRLYLEYFTTIPANWQANLAECERFNSHEEAHIERLKLQQAQAIQTLFEQTWQRVMG